MAIGSCSSCQSSSVYTQSAREHNSETRNNDIAKEQRIIKEKQPIQGNFRSDSNHILDIKA